MPEILRVDPASADAVAILRRYYDDIIARYYGRPATEAEVGEQLAEEGDGELRGDRGVFFMAFHDGLACGCAGARYVDGLIAELTRVFVAPEARGLGLGAALVAEVEAEAMRRGRTTIRLDTRADLVEARALREARLRRGRALQRRSVRRALVREGAHPGGVSAPSGGGRSRRSVVKQRSGAFSPARPSPHRGVNRLPAGRPSCERGGNTTEGSAHDRHLERLHRPGR